MSDTNQTPAAAKPRFGLSRLGRKSRAALAAGAVLGLGATATLAAYSDSEWVTSTFSAAATEQPSVMKIEGSHNNSDFNRNTTITFTTDATKMAPNTSYWAPYWVRNTTDTNVDSRVKIHNGRVTGNADVSSRTVGWLWHAPAGQACGPGNNLVHIGNHGTPLTWDSNWINLTPGATTKFCLEFRLDQAVPEGVARTATYTFDTYAEAR